MVRVTRVLVVDDDPAVLKTVTGFLEAFGIEATSVSNAQAALKLCVGEFPFDLVLADVVMPGIDGVQLGKMLRGRYPALPVLYMTGLDNRLDGLIKDGLVPLVKPFTALHLKDIIDEMLDRPP